MCFAEILDNYFKKIDICNCFLESDCSRILYLMNESEKQYYSISETAEMFGVKSSLLRSWENDFELLKPFKNQKGTRFFTQKDMEIIRTILYLTKEKGYTLQGAKEVIRSNFYKAVSQADMVFKLNTIKEFLLEIKNNL
jgi:DNA-binding transcriptional MerR regulator